MTDLLIVYKDGPEEMWFADLYRDGQFVREVMEDT